jgi:H+/gluconate symporter-like permease
VGSLVYLALFIFVVFVIVIFIAHKLEQESIKTDAIVWDMKFGKWQ